MIYTIGGHLGFLGAEFQNNQGTQQDVLET